jgi:hypothetical protein
MGMYISSRLELSPWLTLNSAVLGLLLLSLLICLITIRRRRALRRNGGLPTPVTGGQYEKPAQHQPGAYEPYPSGTANYTNGYVH